MNPDKEIALHQYVAQKIGIPFEFGVNDCPLLAFGALDIFSGSDHRAEMLGRWDSKASAWRYSDTHGTIRDHLERWGCVEVEQNFMQTGDFILMDTGGDYTKGWRSVALYLGGKVAAMTVKGVEVISLSRVPNIVGVLRYVQR